MRAQHAIIRATMMDHLVHVPVIATAPSPELHILDSACNDGTWMLDVIMDGTTQLQVQPDIKLNLLGTDLDQKHFSDLDLSSALPSNVSVAFQVQDISQPWPDDLSSKFDLVHQRLALQYPSDSDESARQAVARQVNLVQPGTGWGPTWGSRFSGLGGRRQRRSASPAAWETDDGGFLRKAEHQHAFVSESWTVAEGGSRR